MCDTDALAAIEASGDVEVTIEGTTMNVHGVILAFASPVFAALLRSEMREGLARRVDLPGKSKAEFEMFMAFLRPCSRQQVDESNIDQMLPWFDEYQVAVLKERCEELLLNTPVSSQRLLQAHRYQLKRQYARCLEKLPFSSFQNDFEEIASSPEVLKAVLASLALRHPVTQPMCDLLREALDAETPISSMVPVLKILVAHQTSATRLDTDVLEHFRRVLLNGGDTMSVVAELLDAIIGRKRMENNIRNVATQLYEMLPRENKYDKRARDAVLGALVV